MCEKLICCYKPSQLYHTDSIISHLYGSVDYIVFTLCRNCIGCYTLNFVCKYLQVGVYRMSNERIGCSLADAASTPAYTNYLVEASKSPPSLHVVYINTSLETKAFSHELVPTITCTSSNVVQTILQVCSLGLSQYRFSYPII